MKDKKQRFNNIFLIITVILYLMAIAIYELLFCNSELMSHLLRNTRWREYNI